WSPHPHGVLRRKTALRHVDELREPRRLGQLPSDLLDLRVQVVQRTDRPRDGVGLGLHVRVRVALAHDGSSTSGVGLADGATLTHLSSPRHPRPSTSGVKPDSAAWPPVSRYWVGYMHNPL